VEEMRLDRASSFLAKLRAHSKLLNEVALRDLHRIETEELKQLISSIYGYNEEQSLGLIHTLSLDDPESFLTFEPPFFIIQSRVAELFRWLSKNIRLQSHHSLNGIIEEIKSQNEKVIEALDGGLEYSKYQIESSMDIIEYRTAELFRISEENSTHISGVIQRFKEGGIDKEKRAFLAQILLSDHLNPMLKLVEPEGAIEIVFQDVKTSLERVEALHAFPKTVKENARRGVQKQRAIREQLQKIHQYSFTNFVPILQSYVRSTSILLSGATAGVRLVSTYGWKSISPLTEMKLIRSRRPRNILADAWFAGYNARQIQPTRDSDFVPGSITEYIPTLEIENVRPLLENNQVDDILQAVLDLHPQHSLTECSRVANDLIIAISLREKLVFKEQKRYARRNEELEVCVVEVI
jgi:hypothetical protein